MQFSKIISELVAGHEVELQNGDVILQREIADITGGIPRYRIKLINLKSGMEPLYYDTFDEFDEAVSIFVDDEAAIKKCVVCNEYIEDFGYYYDEEQDVCYDNYGCVVKDFNIRFGKGNWSFKDNGFFTSDLAIIVKVSADDIDDYPDVFKQNDEWWRPYHIKYVNLQADGECSINDVFCDVEDIVM